MTEMRKAEAERARDSSGAADVAPLTGDALDAVVFRVVCGFLRDNAVRKALRDATREADDADIDAALARLNASGAFHPVALGFLIEQSPLALRRMFEQATGSDVNAGLARHVTEDLLFGAGLRAALAESKRGGGMLSPLEESLVAGALELARRRGTAPPAQE